jgi:hypothetical protein
LGFHDDLRKSNFAPLYRVLQIVCANFKLTHSTYIENDVRQTALARRAKRGIRRKSPQLRRNVKQ